MKEYDVVVFGAGPGGYVAAIRASQLGARVAVIEEREVGGVCLNRGCIPTKCLLDSAKILNRARRLEERGIKFSEPEINFQKLISYKDNVVKNLRNGILFLFKNNGITLISGKGRLKGPDCVEIEGSEIKGKNIILATGSEPSRPGFIPFKDPKFITSDEILSLEKIPESLTIIGGGAIGCEFASLFQRLGTKVSVCEMLPHLLPAEDKEIGQTIERSFQKRGIEVMTGKRLENLEDISTEKILIAIGRRMNLEGIGLEEIGIKRDEKGFIMIDERIQTNIENIYAVGDITGKGLLAYLASQQGLAAAGNCCGKEERMDYQNIPSAIFTEPEIGTVGLSEEKAKEKGYDITIGKFPFSVLGKAHCIGEKEGFIKIISDKRDEKILGSQIIGESATDIIHIMEVAISSKMTASTLSGIVFAHPTLSEGIREAAEDIYKMAIDLPKRQ